MPIDIWFVEACSTVGSCLKNLQLQHRHRKASSRQVQPDTIQPNQGECHVVSSYLSPATHLALVSTPLRVCIGWSMTTCAGVVQFERQWWRSRWGRQWQGWWEGQRFGHSPKKIRWSSSDQNVFCVKSHSETVYVFLNQKRCYPKCAWERSEIFTNVCWQISTCCL